MKKKLLFSLLSVMLSVAMISGCTKQEEKVPEEVDLSGFETPEGFVWEGTYIDTVEGLAVMTLEKSGDSYVGSVSVPASDMSYIRTCTFTAKPEEDGTGLAYKDGELTAYYLPADDDENPEVTTETVYTGGTGSVFYLDDKIYWMDDKDTNGSSTNLVFRKQENTEETNLTDEELDAILNATESSENADAAAGESTEAAGESTDAPAENTDAAAESTDAASEGGAEPAAAEGTTETEQTTEGE